LTIQYEDDFRVAKSISFANRKEDKSFKIQITGTFIAIYHPKSITKINQK